MEEVEYYIANDTNPETLVNAINERLNKGWELHGTTYVTAKKDDIFFAQALIKTIQKSGPPLQKI